MRQPSARISYLETETITSLSQELVTDDKPNLDLRSRLRLFLLRQLLGTKNSLVYVFNLKEKILQERTNLERLKAEGYIDSYGEGPVYADYPRLNFFGISFSPDKNKPPLRAWGYSLPYEDKALSLQKSFWEVCERHTTVYSSNISTVKYPTFTKGDASFLFELIPRYSEEQTNSDSSLLAQKSDLENITGFYASSLTGGSKRFLPADCFFWGERVKNSDIGHTQMSTIQGVPAKYDEAYPLYGEDYFAKDNAEVHHMHMSDDKYFQDTTTSGSGGGATKTQAILSSLYELIERDVFLLFWLTGVKPPLIDVEDETGEFFDQIREARQRYNLEVYFFNLTYDVAVPSCVCLIIDPVLNLVALGGKVHSAGEEALKNAYMEALATLNVLRSRGKRVPEAVLQKLINQNKWGDESINKTERVNLYHSLLGIATIKKIWLNDNHKSISLAEFCAQGKVYAEEDEELSDLLSQLKALVEKKGEGYHAYVHHFSSVLTKRFGSHVARVFIPAFLKLHLTEKRVTPISQRLVEFAKEHQKIIDSDKDLNHLPHPFP